MTIKKRFEISIALALVFTLLLSFTKFDARCEEIKSGVVRLHILANSDSKYDQNLKLKVRDEILSLDIFSEAKTKEDVINISEDNMDYILKSAQSVLDNNNADYSVSGEITNCFFETRVYEDFTLPAGYYDALRIKIGKAEGKNWWCVLFPKLCIGACTDFSTVISNESEEIINNPQNYKVKFKVVEVIEKIKAKLS